MYISLGGLFLTLFWRFQFLKYFFSKMMPIYWKLVKINSKKYICKADFKRIFLPVHISHCSYLDIYISQNIRLCKGDIEGKFQAVLQAKGIIFLIWKFRFIILIFLLVFAEFVKSTAFYTLLLLFQRVDISKLWFLHQNAIQACQLFEIAPTVCKKQWIWQILQKLEGKWK